MFTTIGPPTGISKQTDCGPQKSGGLLDCDGNPGRVGCALGTRHPPCLPLAALGLAKPRPLPATHHPRSLRSASPRCCAGGEAARLRTRLLALYAQLCELGAEGRRVGEHARVNPHRPGHFDVAWNVVEVGGFLSAQP